MQEMMCRKDSVYRKETRRRDAERIHWKQEPGSREETWGLSTILGDMGHSGLPRNEREAQVILLDCLLETWPPKAREIGETQATDTWVASLRSHIILS